MRITCRVFVSILLLGNLVIFNVQAASRPNIVVILADDQGASDLGVYGATDLQTPHLDGLANEGVRFTQFYAAAPICSASRAALLTGRYPFRAGVPGNVSDTPSGPGGLPLSEVTIAEVLAEHGYRSALIGKWHLGRVDKISPNHQGFDYWFGHANGCIDNYSHFYYWSGHNRHDLYRNGEEVYREGEYFPDLMVEEAISFIDRRGNQPFFLYFALNMPHYPYQGSKKWLEYYEEQNVRYPRNLYNAFVSTLDERIGHLLKALDDRGLADNTIVIFQSDHGHSTEMRAHGGGGSAGRYRGAKQSVFEGGIRSPAIIRWPGVVPAGEVREQWAASIDWLPTLANLLNIDVGALDLDGKSIADVILDTSSQSPHQSMYWLYGKQQALRKGEWKLMKDVVDTSEGAKRSRIGGYFLVNLKEDPSEKKNLASDRPDKVAELSALMQEMLEPEKP